MLYSRIGTWTYERSQTAQVIKVTNNDNKDMQLNSLTLNLAVGLGQR